MNDVGSCSAAARPEGRSAQAGPASKPRRRPVSVPIDPEVIRWVELAKQLPPTRQALIEQVKAEIAAGTYETPERLQAAVARLLDELTDG